MQVVSMSTYSMDEELPNSMTISTSTMNQYHELPPYISARTTLLGPRPQRMVAFAGRPLRGLGCLLISRAWLYRISNVLHVAAQHCSWMNGQQHNNNTILTRLSDGVFLP